MWLGTAWCICSPFHLGMHTKSEDRTLQRGSECFLATRPVCLAPCSFLMLGPFERPRLQCSKHRTSRFERLNSWTSGNYELIPWKSKTTCLLYGFQMLTLTREVQAQCREPRVVSERNKIVFCVSTYHLKWYLKQFEE